MTSAINILNNYLHCNIVNVIDSYMSVRDNSFKFLLVKKYVWYNFKGQIHRQYGPAVVLYSHQNKLINEKWMCYGKLHCIKHPAIVNYDINGIITMQEWYQNDCRVNNCDGSSVLYFDIEGNLVGTFKTVEEHSL